MSRSSVSEEDPNKMKTLSLKELIDSGILQETDRQWFHPLGLALAVSLDSDGLPSELSIIDSRDDVEGIVFDPGVLDMSKTDLFLDFAIERRIARQKKLGFKIQTGDRQMKQFLVSLGGSVYVPNAPDCVAMSIPKPGTRFEITDIPFGDGKAYNQFKFVNRVNAELLADKYPDMWKIVVEE